MTANRSIVGPIDISFRSRLATFPLSSGSLIPPISASNPRFGSFSFGLVWFDSVRLGSVRFASRVASRYRPISASTSVSDCSLKSRCLSMQPVVSASHFTSGISEWQAVGLQTTTSTSLYESSWGSTERGLKNFPKSRNLFVPRVQLEKAKRRPSTRTSDYYDYYYYF